MRFFVPFLAVTIFIADATAQDKVAPVPPLGVAVPDDVKKELDEALASLAKEIGGLQASLKAKPALLDALPDVQIFHRAVEVALKHNEFHNDKEFAAAKKLLALGLERAKSLREGKTPWLDKPGLVVRGYISKIDGSVQPYGLVVPGSYKEGSQAPLRLDVWYHGRGEKLSELSFLMGRLGSAGEFAPANAIVLHPYGRFCNANHFAGEIDTFEAIDHLKKHYPIDNNRIVVRGFSMGGAACWNFAVHYSGLWCAAAPGAGFSETPDFLKVFQKETVQPTWYEKKLFHLYDCTDWAVNLTQCPTVAYSGDKDIQKQAADIMAKALEAEGIKLVHIIGEATGHSYSAKAKQEINHKIDAIAQLGRPTLPKTLRFITYTLRYPKMRWLNVERMTRHWTPARIEAEILSDHEIRVKTEGVEAFSIQMFPGTCPLQGTPTVIIDDDPVPAGLLPSDRSWDVTFVKDAKGWSVGSPAKGLAKRPHLQGPIDDAFMDRFVMVRPTGKAFNDKVGAWTGKEMAHAIDHWRKQFRGDARVIDDTAVTDADIASSNLVLWGDPSSNAILKKIADQLPIAWSAEAIRLGKDGKTFPAANHALTLIYPNPLNPEKYVVLNSGFTFREYDYLNNARQIPKLPDWAILDVDQPATSRRPAGIADAAFFGERWELTPERK
ncbi:MAG: prolyl oligopeptidase family serine peptidase [Planctomycetota bacterium]